MEPSRDDSYAISKESVNKCTRSSIFILHTISRYGMGWGGEIRIRQLEKYKSKTVYPGPGPPGVHPGSILGPSISCLMQTTQQIHLTFITIEAKIFYTLHNNLWIIQQLLSGKRTDRRRTGHKSDEKDLVGIVSRSVRIFVYTVSYTPLFVELFQQLSFSIQLPQLSFFYMRTRMWFTLILWFDNGAIVTSLTSLYTRPFINENKISRQIVKNRHIATLSTR